MIDKTEMYLHSKKLIAISFAIIIFVLGDGQFKQQPEYFGGLIEFEYIEVVPITALIVFLFYWYRFWVFQKSPIQVSRALVLKAIHNDESFKIYANKKAKSEFTRRKKDNIKVSDSLQDRVDNTPVDVSYNFQDLKKKGLYAKQLSANLVNENRSVIGEMNYELGLLRYYHILRIRLKSLLTEQEYSYRVLPHWLAIIAMISSITALFQHFIGFNEVMSLISRMLQGG